MIVTGSEVDWSIRLVGEPSGWEDGRAGVVVDAALKASFASFAPSASIKDDEGIDEAGVVAKSKTYLRDDFLRCGAPKIGGGPRRRSNGESVLVLRFGSP